MKKALNLRIKLLDRPLLLAVVMLITCILPLAAQKTAKTASELYTAGVERQSSEDWYGATELFQEALAKNPTYGDAWFNLAQCAYQLGDFELAVTYSENAEKYAKSNTAILNLRGMAYIALGKLTEARTIFEKILSVYPNDVEARFGLAELDLFNGKLTSAENIYRDALKRQGTNRRALLSLALVSAELGKNDIASIYIDQALQYHSGDSGVHYLAAYLSAKQGDFAEAEHQARAAVQISPNYDRAYLLLASILYNQKKYAEVLDICEYGISRYRKSPSIWYLKGLAQYRLGEVSDAVDTWAMGVSINPQDEIMRSALELVAGSFLPLEDSRRAAWADYHSKKAIEYNKQFLKSQVVYEYQRALKIDPLNISSRSSYADLLRNDELYELYLDQLRFIQENGDFTQRKEAAVQLADKIEAFSSLLSDTLSLRWNVKPLYLDKIRWKLGIYYMDTPVQLFHADSEWITSGMVAEMFSGVSSTSVSATYAPVADYGQAFRHARENGLDYFIIISINENAREVTIDADMYSARTGTKTVSFSVFRTGNDRYANALRRLRQGILEVLPIRGEVIARDGKSKLLIDLGRADGIVAHSVFEVVKQGSLSTADTGPGLSYDKDAVLGQFTTTVCDEEISEGDFKQNGFFDRLNVGDEVVVLQVPKKKKATTQSAVPVSQETEPAATVSGTPVVEEPDATDLTINGMGLRRTPLLIDLIRNIY
ncbi:MAG: tetratricopeptide repeat protein [Treponema sp.]|nr:tetratricopeptide repeat protein [Treponema sp.]